MLKGEGRGDFPTTRWSLIIAAQKQQPESGVLSTLCELYWYPVYSFIRRQSNGMSEAEDLTQSFFAHILEKKSVLAADQNRGRFRAFLLGSVKNFLSHQRERAAAQKRGGNKLHVRFDSETAERLYQQERPAASATPEEIFERNWALQLLDSTLEQLKLEYEERGEIQQFKVLAPLLETPDEGEYDHAAAALGKSVDTVRVTVFRMRKRLRNLFRDLVAATVPPDLVDDEIRHLLNSLS